MSGYVFIFKEEPDEDHDKEILKGDDDSVEREDISNNEEDQPINEAVDYEISAYNTSKSAYYTFEEDQTVIRLLDTFVFEKSPDIGISGFWVKFAEYYNDQNYSNGPEDKEFVPRSKDSLRRRFNRLYRKALEENIEGLDEEDLALYGKAKELGEAMISNTKKKTDKIKSARLSRSVGAHHEEASYPDGDNEVNGANEEDEGDGEEEGDDEDGHDSNASSENIVIENEDEHESGNEHKNVDEQGTENEQDNVENAEESSNNENKQEEHNLRLPTVQNAVAEVPFDHAQKQKTIVSIVQDSEQKGSVANDINQVAANTPDYPTPTASETQQVQQRIDKQHNKAHSNGVGTTTTTTTTTGAAYDEDDGDSDVEFFSGETESRNVGGKELVLRKNLEKASKKELLFIIDSQANNIQQLYHQNYDLQKMVDSLKLQQNDSKINSPSVGELGIEIKALKKLFKRKYKSGKPIKYKYKYKYKEYKEKVCKKGQ